MSRGDALLRLGDSPGGGVSPAPKRLTPTARRRVPRAT